MKISKILLSFSFFLINAAFTLYAYSAMPEQYPHHMVINGTMDTWTTKSLFSWMIIPVIGAVINCMLLASSAILRRYPALLNIPQKEKFMAFPKEKQYIIFDYLDSMMVGIGGASQLLLCSLVYAAYQAGMTMGQFFPAILYLGVIGNVLLVYLIVKIYLNKIKLVLN